MGGSVSSGRSNDDLVDNLVSANFIRTDNVEKVMRDVDRGHYQQCSPDEWPYKDSAWRKGPLHISAPCIYSEVLEGLQLKLGHSFLNLGSGTGYLSTMAGLLVGPSGVNHGVELNPTVVQYAEERLKLFKLNNPAMDWYDFCEPSFIVGDCLQLAPESPKYDRIYCGASCPPSHETYLKQLLKPEGILVVPMNDRLVQITRLNDNNPPEYSERGLLPVSFTCLVETPLGPPVHLPGIDAPSLQDLARWSIRQQVRSTFTQLEGPKRANKVSRKSRHRFRQRARFIFDDVPDAEGENNADRDRDEVGNHSDTSTTSGDTSDQEDDDEDDVQALEDRAIVLLCNPSDPSDIQNDSDDVCQEDERWGFESSSDSVDTQHSETLPIVPYKDGDNLSSKFQDKIDALRIPETLKTFLKYKN